MPIHSYRHDVIPRASQKFPLYYSFRENNRKLILIFFLTQYAIPRCHKSVRRARCRQTSVMMDCLRRCRCRATRQLQTASTDTRSSLAIGDLLKTPHINQLPFIQYDSGFGLRSSIVTILWHNGSHNAVNRIADLYTSVSNAAFFCVATCHYVQTANCHAAVLWLEIHLHSFARFDVDVETPVFELPTFIKLPETKLALTIETS